MDFKEDLLINAWEHESKVANEFRKRGYTVSMPPVSLPLTPCNRSEFLEDCDFTVTKGRQTWKVMVKSCEILNDLDHENPLDSVQQIELPPYKQSRWRKNGSTCLPIDPTWRNKFWMHCSKAEMPQWYSERLWSVSDQDARTLFFFKGSDVLSTNLTINYYGEKMWNFMPVTEDTKCWSSSYLPYLEEPWAQ